MLGYLNHRERKSLGDVVIMGTRYHVGFGEPQTQLPFFFQRLRHPRWCILPEHVAGITAVLCEHLDAPALSLEWSVSGALALPA